MMLGPDLNVVSAIHSTGWGSDGQNEAIIFIVETPGDEWVWNGFLYNALGPFVQTEDKFVTLQTDVGYVVIMANEATFYSGPGLSYEPVATVFGGFNYPVIGISEDGAWWRLTCYDDNNAPISACWVSTDPTITAPTAPPPGG
jgi:hypothetical protein